MHKFLLATFLGIASFAVIKLTKYQPGGVSAAVPTQEPAGVSVVAPSPATSPSVSEASDGSTPTPTATPPGSTSSLKSGTYSGDTIDIGYGPVQVQITVTSGKIASVTMLQVPTERARSYQIAQYSTPTLIREAISAQSANVDSVSGATFTSQGFVESLQSAIAKAKS